MRTDALISAISDAQDETADIVLLQKAIGIESITGNETDFARFLGEQLRSLGLNTQHAAFERARENVWGSNGSGNAPHLMIAGHSDTVHVRGWQEHWQGDERADPFGGVEKDGQIWGRGASDLKGGICTAIAGVRLLQQAGYELEGTITLAFVGDEESGEPGSGVSAGIKDLVTRIKAGEIGRPDFAIYVEPTSLDIHVSQIGFFIADISVTGKTAYFGTPELGIDALMATHQLLARVWDHEKELVSGPKHELVGASSILVTAIEGGGFIAVPGQCKFSLIRKLRPGEELDEAIAQFEAALSSSELEEGINVSITYPAGRDHPKGGSSVETTSKDGARALLQKCIRQFKGEAGAFNAAPYWSEMPFLTEQIGCPAVYCAPGDIAVAHTFEERIERDEYLAAIRAFALFVAQYCGVKAKS